MKQLLLWAIIILSFYDGYSQAKFQTVNVADIKGAMVKREEGDYTDLQSRKTIGHFSIVYIIDTIQHQLLNVSITSSDRNGESIYLYYYTSNQLSKASSGVVESGYTIVRSIYSYDDEDYRMSEKELDVFSATEEKYALLKESRKYLAVLKKY